jgi:hypothetical protein
MLSRNFSTRVEVVSFQAPSVERLDTELILDFGCHAARQEKCFGFEVVR